MKGSAFIFILLFCAFCVAGAQIDFGPAAAVSAAESVSAVSTAAEEETGPAFDFRPMVDTNIVQKLSDAYLHNRLVVAWVGPASWREHDLPVAGGAGKAKPVSRLRVTADCLPANAPFFVPVVGPRADAVKVRATLAAVTNALPSDVRDVLVQKNALGPVLQWLLRCNLPSLSPDGSDYLSARAHPAAFMADHFNTAQLTNAAARLTLAAIPPIAFILPVYEEYERDPLPRMVPGRDFADLHPEETFATPFAISYVLRAPEVKRRFRFCARTWGAGNRQMEYAWRVVRGRGVQRIAGYAGDKTHKPENGFAEVTLNRHGMSTRVDIAVCSRIPGGVWGPPALISFFQPPDLVADYYRSGALRELAYKSAVAPDDPYRKALLPLYTPRNWTDTFELDEKGAILVISRRPAGSVFADRFVRATGEKLLESWSSGLPKKTISVEYYVDSDGYLAFREKGEVQLHPAKP